MRLTFAIAGLLDAAELAALHNSVANDLTRRYGEGVWSSQKSEKGALLALRTTRVVIARRGRKIVGTLNLQTKKPWAVDVTYFTPVKKAIYLTGMAVVPAMQGKGIGRLLLDEASRHVRAWPAEALRLDAWDAEAGAGGFYAKCGFREMGRVIYRKAPLVYFERVLPQEETNQ
jgi:GNAT superfamily N-acetyltransferase